jgi:HNH endonuclease
MIAERMECFESKIERVPFGGCWVWCASLNNKGYGVLSINGRMRYAHRISYQLHYGDLEQGNVVMHRCDNPSCVNPHHLSKGTQADNVRDMMEKGRRTWVSHFNGPQGEVCHFAKLTSETVVEIRKRYSSGKETMKSLGEIFGVTQPVVSRIINRKIWKRI